jgi:hypothetical protein
MLALAGLCGLVAFVCTIIILVHAFSKGGVAQGLLSLFIPFYIFYYAFARFEHEKRGMILAVWIGAFILQVCLVVFGVGTAVMSST